MDQGANSNTKLRGVFLIYSSFSGAERVRAGFLNLGE